MSVILFGVIIMLLVVGVVSTSAAVILAAKRPYDATPRGSSDRTTQVVSIVALGWTIVVGALLLLAPVATARTSSMYSGADGQVVSETTTSSQSLLAQEGSSVIVVLLIPIVISLVGALGHRRSARARRIGAGVVLVVLCLLGMMSIGLFYVPAAALLVVAGGRTRRWRRSEPRVQPVTA